MSKTLTPDVIMDAHALKAFYDDCDDPEYVAGLFWDTKHSEFKQAMKVAVKRLGIDTRTEWYEDTLYAHKWLETHGEGAV